MFTQPLMYKQIKKQKSVLSKFAEKLVVDGVFTTQMYQVNISTLTLLLNIMFVKLKILIRPIQWNIGFQT